MWLRKKEGGFSPQKPIFLHAVASKWVICVWFFHSSFNKKSSRLFFAICCYQLIAATALMHAILINQDTSEKSWLLNRQTWFFPWCYRHPGKWWVSSIVCGQVSCHVGNCISALLVLCLFYSYIFPEPCKVSLNAYSSSSSSSTIQWMTYQETCQKVAPTKEARPFICKFTICFQASHRPFNIFIAIAEMYSKMCNARPNVVIGFWGRKGRDFKVWNKEAVHSLSLTHTHAESNLFVACQRQKDKQAWFGGGALHSWCTQSTKERQREREAEITRSMEHNHNQKTCTCLLLRHISTSLFPRKTWLLVSFWFLFLSQCPKESGCQRHANSATF